MGHIAISEAIRPYVPYVLKDVMGHIARVRPGGRDVSLVETQNNPRQRPYKQGDVTLLTLRLTRQTSSQKSKMLKSRWWSDRITLPREGTSAAA